MYITATQHTISPKHAAGLPMDLTVNEYIDRIETLTQQPGYTFHLGYLGYSAEWIHDLWLDKFGQDNNALAMVLSSRTVSSEVWEMLENFIGVENDEESDYECKYCNLKDEVEKIIQSKIKIQLCCKRYLMRKRVARNLALAMAEGLSMDLKTNKLIDQIETLTQQPEYTPDSFLAVRDFPRRILDLWTGRVAKRLPAVLASRKVSREVLEELQSLAFQYYRLHDEVDKITQFKIKIQRCGKRYVTKKTLLPKLRKALAELICPICTEPICPRLHHASLLNSSIKQVNCVGGMAGIEPTPSMSNDETPLSPFQLGQGGLGLHTTPCGHLFHTNCIKHWTAINPECPMCPMCRAGL
jgi:hypothetical protein